MTHSHSSWSHASRSPHAAPAMVKPRLWRSRKRKVIAGVLGGLAEKYHLDPGLARILFVAFSVFSAGFPGTVVYVILWAITSPYDVQAEG